MNAPEPEEAYPFPVRPIVEPMALRLTVENMEFVATYFGGDVKGTMLPPERRVVQFYGGGGGRIEAAECEARVGDWIVLHAAKDVEVLNEVRFLGRYGPRAVDSAPAVL